jgi:hypothetical protein
MESQKIFQENYRMEAQSLDWEINTPNAGAESKKNQTIIDSGITKQKDIDYFWLTTYLFYSRH